MPCAAVGLLYYFSGVGLTYLAARHLSSAHLACLSITVVFFSMAIKALVHGTRVAASNVIGALVSTAGLALFFVDRDTWGGRHQRRTGPRSVVGSKYARLATLIASRRHEETI